MSVTNSAIKFARDSTAAIWLPEQIDDPSSGMPLAALHCGGCSVPVSAFHSTTLRTGTERSPHFKIKGARGVTRTHEHSCDFHLRTAVRDMLRLTRTVQRSLADSRWEIVIPADINHQPAAEPAKVHVMGPGVSLTGPSHSSGPSHRLVLLNDIRRVVNLLHYHRDDPDSRDSFSAVWRGSSISWDDFYYPPDRHHILIDRVAAAPGGRLNQPAVVSGQVVRTRRSAAQTPSGERLTLYLALAHDTRTLPTNLVVRGEPQYFPSIDKGAAVVAFTQWRSWSPAPDSSRVTYCTGWLDWPHKIAVIDPDLLDT